MLLFNIEFRKIAGLYGYCAGNAIKERKRVPVRTGYNWIGPSADRNRKRTGLSPDAHDFDEMRISLHRNLSCIRH